MTDDLTRAMCDIRRQNQQRIVSETAEVREIGERIGYGNVMYLAQKLWRDWAILQGLAGSEFSIGPCAAMMRPCTCTPSQGGSLHCEWCCGSGLVTERVLRAIEEEKRQ